MQRTNLKFGLCGRATFTKRKIPPNPKSTKQDNKVFKRDSSQCILLVVKKLHEFCPSHAEPELVLQRMGYHLGRFLSEIGSCHTK